MKLPRRSSALGRSHVTTPSPGQVKRSEKPLKIGDPLPAPRLPVRARVANPVLPFAVRDRQRLS